MKTGRKVFLICIAGIILRIILMGAFSHIDLLSRYWDAHQLVYHQTPGGNPSYLRPLFSVHYLWLSAVRNLINCGQDVWPENGFLQDGRINTDTVRQFSARPDTHWILFLLKLPYFLMEILMVVFLIKMFPAEEQRQKVLSFLVFNPVSLFVISISGANDIFPVFFMVFSLYLLRKDKIYLSMLFLGISIYAKFYTIFLLPVFIFVLGMKRQTRLKLLFFGLVPFIVSLIFALIGGSAGAFIKYILAVPQFDYMLSLVLPFQHGYDRIYPFILGYSLLLLYITYRQRQISLFAVGCEYALVSALLFYSLCFFEPQSFLLMVPLAVFKTGNDKRFLQLFFLLTGCFFIYTFFQWCRDTNQTAVPGFIQQFYPVDKITGILRSVFSAVCFWIILCLLDLKKSLTGGI